MAFMATANGIAAGSLRMATAIAQIAMQFACEALSGPPPQSMSWSDAELSIAPLGIFIAASVMA